MFCPREIFDTTFRSFFSSSSSPKRRGSFRTQKRRMLAWSQAADLHNQDVGVDAVPRHKKAISLQKAPSAGQVGLFDFVGVIFPNTHATITFPALMQV